MPRVRRHNDSQQSRTDARETLSPQRAPAPGTPIGDKPLVLRNARVVNILDKTNDDDEDDGDETGNFTIRVSDAVDVIIVDGLVAEILHANRQSVRLHGSEWTELDCAGRLVLPGLLDCHVHVTASSSNLRSPGSLPQSLVIARSCGTLRGMLDRGFTSVRDMGGADHGLAQAVEEGSIVGPRLFFCGKALSATGGHGDMRDRGESQLPACPCCQSTIGRVVDGARDCRRAVRDFVRTGATHIKFMASGGVSSPTDRLTSLQFSQEELDSIIDEARLSGTPTAAHAYTPASILRAVEAGVTSIEHGNYASDECLDAMADRGCFLVPTLVTYWAIVEEGAADGMPQNLVDKVGDLVESGIDTLQRAVARRVQVAYGSDLLGASHRHQLRGIALHCRAQMPVDVLASLTVVPARLVGMEGKLGCVGEASCADMLVVDDDRVLEDPSLLAGEGVIKHVIQGGRIIR